ncbi:hypothetical protein VNI00_017273 [Paramarasmius palmivorus]|uniref:Uncharacterized protein n=1 Tax=Paramarasmius palmivorus TaxID=297713 RepID=A0AAW0B8X3_9AGAR
MKSWERHVVEWENDRRDDCPYEMNQPSVSDSFPNVKRSLAEEEKEREKKEGSPAMWTFSGMIVDGLSIEEAQRSISALTTQGELTVYQETIVEERRTLLWKRIRRFRDGQLQLMEFLKAKVESIPDNLEAESIPLLLPSGLDKSTRDNHLSTITINMELRLRNAQCFDALAEVRSSLQARTLAYQHSTAEAPSQKVYTRLNTLRSQIEADLTASIQKYHTARTALLELKGPGAWEKVLRVLKREDIRGIGERVMRDNEEADFRKAQRRAGVSPKDIEAILGGKTTSLPLIFVDPTLPCDPGKRETISWVHYTFADTASTSQNPAELVNSTELQESLRVEWLKARARARRAREEVLLVDEEMRRAIQYCQWQSSWWKAQIGLRENLLPWIQEGLCSYAWEQSAAETHRAQTWEVRLDGVRRRARAVREWIDNPKKDLEELLKNLPQIEVEVHVDDDKEDSDDDGDC